MNGKEEYEQITKLIEAEKDRHLDRLITALVAINQEENESMETAETSTDETIQRRDEEHSAMVTLLSLRIKAGCEGIRFHLFDCLDQIKEDIKELISNVQSLEYEWEITDAVKSDSYDLLCSICAPDDRLLIDQSYSWNRINIANAEVTTEMFFLFKNVAQYLHDINRIPESVKLLESLCTFSRDRNNPAHVELVCRAIAQICDDEPETTCRICDIDRHLFINDTSLYTGDFFWFYGCALMKLERPEDALRALDKCYLIRKQILGETSYYTALARRETALCKFVLSKKREGKEDLKYFVDQIEAGFFSNEADLEQLQIVEAKTLYLLLENSSDIPDPDEYKKYLKIYGQLCLKYEYTGEPYISMRLAWNMRGGYYLNLGDYIRAESAFLNALRVNVADESKSILSYTQIQSNLLLIYYAQNDMEKAYPLVIELLDAMEKDETDKYFNDADIYRIHTVLISLQMQAMIEPEQDEIDDIKALLNETCDDVLSGESANITREQAIFAIICIFYLLQQETLSMSEQRECGIVLRQLEENVDSFDFAPMQTTLLHYCQALLLWNIGDTNAEAYFEKTVDHIYVNGIQHTQRAAMIQSYAAYLCKRGNFDVGYNYLKKALDEVSATWQQYVRYLNDYRLLMILTPVQLTSLSCYSIIRQSVDIGAAYEQLLRFKALASLAGRERNRIIHRNSFDTVLVDRIRGLQNTIAALESENMIRNTDSNYELLSEELRRAERDFAIQFPQNVAFTEISLETVQEAIPNYTAVLEYYWTLNDYGQTQYESNSNPDEDHTIFDVYITTKESGKCHMQRITIPSAGQVSKDARTFVLTMQHISAGEATIEEIEELDTIRFRLYDAIISPILPMIEGYGTVYIAPDNELMNLPFDLLYGEDGISLADWHNCVKIECARDFLFKNDENSSEKGALIVSNPEYEVRERVIEPEQSGKTDIERQRAFNLDINTIAPLPFTQVEAYRVSSRIGGELYTGAYATKQVVLSAEGYENIHIATHGYFDTDSEDASLYSSCLIFAGIKNWYQTGQTSPQCGNGFLTADEVSRMDLSTTKLVVLSSCLSGMNDVLFNAGFYGMVSALSAAGVKYVISNLWSANDLASAVFMDAFYYYYANGWNEPPIALSKARDYLKNVTIDELRRQGWFHPTTYQMLDMESRNFLYSLEQKNGKLRPFRNESFWGGFTCYECY